MSKAERKKYTDLRVRERSAQKQRDRELGNRAFFIDYNDDDSFEEPPPEPSLKEKLAKVYPKEKPKRKENKDSEYIQGLKQGHENNEMGKEDTLSKQERVKEQQNKVREVWEKKDKEFKEQQASEANAHQEEIKHIQTLDSLVSQYDQLQKLLEKAITNKNGEIIYSNSTKVSKNKEINNLIQNVYHGFGKNAGTNTNRNVTTVLNQLEKWEKDKEEKIKKIEELKAKQSEKFQSMVLQKKIAKEAEAKSRLPPKTSNRAVTVQEVVNKNKVQDVNKNKDKPLTIEELGGGGGRVVPKGEQNRNRK
jgi:hypothetical protein